MCLNNTSLAGLLHGMLNCKYISSYLSLSYQYPMLYLSLQLA